MTDTRLAEQSQRLSTKLHVAGLFDQVPERAAHLGVERRRNPRIASFRGLTAMLDGRWPRSSELYPGEAVDVWMISQARRTAPFFFVTFIFTWGLQVPGLLARQGVFPGKATSYVPLAGLGIFGPLVAAAILTRREQGNAGVKALFAPLLRWRVHPQWYLAALLPAILLTGLLFLLNLSGRRGPLAYVPAASGVAFGLIVSVAEEVGWRGFALPRLQERWGRFAASGLLGAIWYLWHLPMFIGLGVPLNLVLVMLLYFSGASLLLTWIYNGTGGSLLLAALAHMAAHLNNSHRALPLEVVPVVAHAIIFAALGLLVMRGPLLRRSATAERTRPVTGHGPKQSA